MENKINNDTSVTRCIENLAPVTDGENQEIYVEILEKGIEDKKVKNIALSGSYGSGKSSIIQKFLSLLSKNEKNKYLEISLANFDKNIKKEDEEQHIEKSILQQIFYKVSKSELPHSKLERTEKKSESSIVGNSIAFFIWLVSFYIFIKASDIKKLLVDIFNLQDINIQTMVVLFSFIPLLITTLYIIYMIVKGTGKIRLNKFTIQGATLEIDNKKGSLINQNIDEILYFFEATNYEVLIIEDLDRQDGTKIFQKLREINTLLNNYTKINNSKKITFIYAVKDSIFTGEERTKFFELIIPIVPIVNTSNAKDILIQKFTKIDILNKVGKDFLKDISYYIHNYKQLTNIVNEFCVYQEALKNTQDYKKLFALITYKNFFPKDFSDLQNRQGMVYNILHNQKLKIRDKLIDELNDKVIVLNERLRSMEEENLNDERELRLVFASKLFGEVDNLIGFSNNNSFININQLVDNDELFNQYVVEGGNIHYFYNQHNRTARHFKGDESGEYEKRLIILRDKPLEKEKKISKEKEKIQSEIREIKYEKLQKLLEGLEDKNLLDINDLIDEDITNWKLVKKMIIDGYIDEDYSRYISYFHEGELTRNDYDFIVKIKDGDSLDFTYTLDNAKEVIDELSINDFKNNIENLTVAEYMFETNTITDKRKYFVDNFFEKSSDTFLRELLEKNLENKSLISIILKEASKKIKLNILFSLLKREDNSIRQLLISVIDNLNSINLALEDKVEFNNLLVSFLFDIYDKLKNKKPIEKYLLDERVIFDNLTDLNYRHSTELFEFIYQNSLHKLSYENIKPILVNLFNFKISEEIKLKTANLTTLRESGAKELLDDINENIDFYFEDCWSKLEENTEESEKTLLYLLNHANFKDQYKIDVIKKVETKIENITTIEDKELWKKLFKENKINATWDNTFEYYINTKNLDEVLLNFLNNNDNSELLSSTRVGSKYFEEHEELKNKDAVTLLRKILENNHFDNENYKNIIKSYGYWYSDLNLEELDVDKIQILINTGRLQPEEEVYNAIYENCSECAVLFIEHYKKEYLEEKFNAILDSNICIDLLKSLKFTNDEKFKIIENTDISFFNSSQELRDKASELYIDNNSEIKNLDLFEKLFYGENKHDLELLVSQISYWDVCNSIQTYLNEFDKPYSELLEESARKLYLEDKAINRLLLQKLEEKDYITSFKEHKSMLGKKELKVEKRRGCN